MAEQAVQLQGRTRAHRWLRSAVIALALGGLLVVGAGIGAGFYLSSPAPAKIGAAPAGSHGEEGTIASGSDANLRGWFIKGKPGGGAVVLLHGVRGNRLAMLRRAALFSAEGFSVLLFDF